MRNTLRYLSWLQPQRSGYSNCNSSYTSNDYNFIGLGDNALYSGMLWQCVEYARRWIITNKDLTFDSVNCASDIWHLNNVWSTRTAWAYPKVDLNRVPNGSKCQPAVGNLVIYKRIDPDNPYGHVNIITEVGSNYILVAEQNWNNDYWPGTYARNVSLTLEGGLYTISDVLPILGWMQYEHIKYRCGDVECQTCTAINTESNIICTYA